MYKRNRELGLGILESALLLAFFLPLSLVALSTWERMRQQSFISELVTRSLESIHSKPFLLAEHNGGVGLKINRVALEPELQQISRSMETSLLAALGKDVERYGVQVLLLHESQVDTKVLKRPEVLLKIAKGDLAKDVAYLGGEYSDFRSRLKVGRNGDSKLDQRAMVGISVIIEPKKGLFDVFSGDASDRQIHYWDVINLRGDVTWE